MMSLSLATFAATAMLFWHNVPTLEISAAASRYKLGTGLILTVEILFSEPIGLRS